MPYTNIDNTKVSLLTLVLSRAFASLCYDVLMRKCAKLNINSYRFSSVLALKTQATFRKAKLSIGFP